MINQNCKNSCKNFDLIKYFSSIRHGYLYVSVIERHAHLREVLIGCRCWMWTRCDIVDISEAQIREANLHNEFDNIEYK